MLHVIALLCNQTLQRLNMLMRPKVLKQSLHMHVHQDNSTVDSDHTKAAGRQIIFDSPKLTHR